MSKLERGVDVPENRLLKLFLFEVARAAGDMSATVGHGDLHSALLTVAGMAKAGLHDRYLRDVPLVSVHTTKMLLSAWRARHSGYKQLADLFELRFLTESRHRLASLARLIADGWIAPLRSDDIFEFFVFMLILDTLQEDLGCTVQEYGLIMHERECVAQLTGMRNEQVSVFFDQAPRMSGLDSRSLSEYVRTCDGYEGLGDYTVRRPDILIVCDVPQGARRFLLVEVKDTVDVAYTADSIYKCLAYLRDFSSLWARVPGQRPKAILAIPQLIRAKPSAGGDLRVWSASPSNRSELAALVSTALFSTASKMEPA